MRTKMKYVSEDSLPPRASTNGFWVKGDTIYDVTHGKHVMFITENLAKFGLNKKEVGEVYKRHNEASGTEGTAIGELVRYATSQGWIRVRHYWTPKDYWSIQCDDTEKRKQVIWDFIGWALANKIMGENDPAVILGYDHPSDIRAFTCQTGGIKTYLSGAH